MEEHGKPVVIGIDLSLSYFDPAWHAVTIVYTPESLRKYLKEKDGKDYLYSVLDGNCNANYKTEDDLKSYLEMYNGHIRDAFVSAAEVGSLPTR